MQLTRVFPRDAQVLVQLVHPGEVVGSALPKAVDRGECGPVDGADHPHLRMQGEARQPVSAGGARVGAGGKGAGAVAGMAEHGSHQPLPDAAALVAR
nr:hypothetical protein [Streptomyces sp. A1-5]